MNMRQFIAFSKVALSIHPIKIATAGTILSRRTSGIESKKFLDWMNWRVCGNFPAITCLQSGSEQNKISIEFAFSYINKLHV